MENYILKETGRPISLGDTIALEFENTETSEKETMETALTEHLVPLLLEEGIIEAVGDTPKESIDLLLAICKQLQEEVLQLKNSVGTLAEITQKQLLTLKDLISELANLEK